MPVIITRSWGHCRRSQFQRPSTLRYSHHLIRLDRAAREVAQIGAALGRQFSHELISAVATMPSSNWTKRYLNLNEAMMASAGCRQRGITFKHALVQDTAYSTLLRSRRLQLHARIC